MTAVLDRLGGWFPVAVATALPVFYLTSVGDSFILPRTSLVIVGACVGLGLALITGRTGHLGALKWPVMAAAAAAVLAFAFSISWPLSLAGSYTRYESLPVRLSYLGLLVSSAWLLCERSQREWLVAGFVFGTSVASLEGVWQFASHAPFRPDGDLGNANLLAALIAMAFPLALQRALRNDVFLFAWVVALVVLVAGWWVTTSRSGGAGIFLGALLLGVLAVKGRAVIAAGAVWIAALGAVLLLVVFTPIRLLNNDPPELRLHLWADGLRMIAARPLTGWGEEGTGLAFGHYLSRDYASLVTFDRIHSGPLDIAATQGVIGLIALGWVLVVIAKAAWRRRLEPDVAGLAAALAGYTVWVIFNFDWAPATGPFWLLAGTLWAAAEGRHDRTASTRVKSVFAVALAIAAVVFAVLPLLADAWYLRGRSDLAVRVDPLQAQYHWALGTIPELQRASDLGETTPDMYVQLGDGYRREGDLSDARAAYRRALEIDPYFTPATQRLAQI